MADYVNKIEVDASFFQGEDGDKLLPVSFSPQEDRYKGYTNIFNSIVFGTPLPTYYYISTAYITEVATTNSLNHIVDLDIIEAASFFIDNSVQYFTGYTVISGSNNLYVDCKVYNLFSPSFKEIGLYYTAGREFKRQHDLLSTFYVVEDKNKVGDYLTNYTNYTGYNDFYSIPLPAWDGIIDFPTDYTNPSGVYIGWDKLVEIFFAGWVSTTIYGDTFCSLENIYYTLSYCTAILGMKNGLYTDVFASQQAYLYFNGDLFSSLLYQNFISSATDTIPGIKNGVLSDCFVSVLNTDTYINTDIPIFPIYFDNFSIGLSYYAPSGTIISVDAHDSVYGLIASGTYFKVNGSTITTHLDNIDDGFKLQIPDYNISEPTTITAHAENNNGDFL